MCICNCVDMQYYSMGNLPPCCYIHIVLLHTYCMELPIPFTSGDVLGFSPGPSTSLTFQMSSSNATGSTYAYMSHSTELSRVSTSPTTSVEGMCIYKCTHACNCVDMRKIMIILLLYEFISCCHTRFCSYGVAHTNSLVVHSDSYAPSSTSWY